MKISSWGKYPLIEGEVRSFGSEEDLGRFIRNLSPWIPRGLGRSYGDSSLSANMVSTLKWNRFLSFDEKSGRLHCQAGVSFEEILEVFVPRGWFPPVTPGTKFITVGGAVASDVHGKNHHKEGSFSKHLESFRLLTPSGDVKTCSRAENFPLFEASCGGMGLTGVILDASFRMRRIETSYIRQTSLRANNLDEIFRSFEEHRNATYSVAWVDCLARGKHTGRSLLLLGEHASLKDLKGSRHEKELLKTHRTKKINIPFSMPGFMINSLSVRIFNWIYYRRVPAGIHTSFIHYDPYFYPLDAISNWNRLYGKRGFTQYQLVLPAEKSFDGLEKILDLVSRNGLGSPLTVLKAFGSENGMLSFPMEGYTLALDFPISNNLFSLLDSLDTIVQECGGRVYLSKDCRMTADAVKRGYPRLEEFLKIRQELDGDKRLKSMQSERLNI